MPEYSLNTPTGQVPLGFAPATEGPSGIDVSSLLGQTFLKQEVVACG